MIHAISEQLSHLQYSLTLSKLKGHTKINIKLVSDFDVEKIPLKLQHDTSNYYKLMVGVLHKHIEQCNVQLEH